MTVREIDVLTGEESTRGYTPQEEAAVAQGVAQTNPLVQRLIAIDSEAELTPRAFRELVILMAEGFKMVTNGALDLRAIVPGVAQVVALEEEAVTIRNQLSSGD